MIRHTSRKLLASYEPSTVCAMYFLDYALPQLAKMSRSLQAEKKDLTGIAPLVDTTLDTLLAENWVLKSLDVKDKQPLSSQWPQNSSFSSRNERQNPSWWWYIKLICFTRCCLLINIFDPKKVPTADSYSVDVLLATTVQSSLQILLMVMNTPRKLSYYSNRVAFEVTYLSKQAKGTLYSQLTELTTNEMLITMFPNISTLANVCLSIPIGTASVKTRLRNQIRQSSLSYLTNIAIETSEKQKDTDLDASTSIWNRKPRRIAVWIVTYTVLLYTCILPLTFAFV